MKIEDVDIYDLPIWACAVVDEISETCKNRLKSSPEYSRILKERDELLFKYPFISKLIDRDEINEPMELSIEKAKAGTERVTQSSRPALFQCLPASAHQSLRRCHSSN